MNYNDIIRQAENFYLEAEVEDFCILYPSIVSDRDSVMFLFGRENVITWSTLGGFKVINGTAEFIKIALDEICQIQERGIEVENKDDQKMATKAR